MEPMLLALLLMAGLMVLPVVLLIVALWRVGTALKMMAAVEMKRFTRESR